MSPWSARRLVADALDVRHRLPRIWARVVAREARVATPGSSRPAPGTSRSRPRRMSTRRWPTLWTGRCPGAGSRPGWPARSSPPTRRPRRSARPHGRRSSSRSGPGPGAGHRRVLRALHGRGDRPAGGDRRVPGRRAGRVRGPRPRGPAPGQGPVALLANPVRAVELLAAFAALRAGPRRRLPAPDGTRRVARRARPAGGLARPAGQDSLDQPEERARPAGGAARRAGQSWPATGSTGRMARPIPDERWGGWTRSRGGSGSSRAAAGLAQRPHPRATDRREPATRRSPTGSGSTGRSCCRR